MLSGIDVLKNAFIKVYSDFLAREEHGYLVMTATELASLTGFNKALFENHSVRSLDRCRDGRDGKYCRTLRQDDN